MDLLSQTYASASDDDGVGAGEKDEHTKREALTLRTPKMTRSGANTFRPHAETSSELDRGRRPLTASIGGAPLDIGRYVSKRERAMLDAPAGCPMPLPAPLKQQVVVDYPVVGSIADSDLSNEILNLLRCKQKFHGRCGRFPEKSLVLNGHDNAVNSIQWSPGHAHLLASAGMDQMVCVWNVWNKSQQKARIFKYHNAAVKDVRWSLEGFRLLSCGYDCSSRLVDVEKGIQIQQFKEDQIVEVIRFQPRDSNLFLSGGSKGFLKLWDIRNGKVVHQYCRDLGIILDIEFSNDGKHLISSSDTTKSRISENAIIVWDVSREIPLSNQVYAEAYTCPCIRYHPSDACFVAQSNGNYIAIFSATYPFKLDKYKRYEEHGVWGYPIKCSFSFHGDELVSGSSDGCIYVYNYRSSELLRKIKAFEEPCIDVAFHHRMPNVIASCSWTGNISVFH